MKGSIAAGQFFGSDSHIEPTLLPKCKVVHRFTTSKYLTMTTNNCYETVRRLISVYQGVLLWLPH